MVITEDIKRLNELLDKLTQNKFFENYKELRDFYEYLADKYQFDLKSHGVDPSTGEVIPIDNDKVYFDKKSLPEF
jgi:hypothetical protein